VLVGGPGGGEGGGTVGCWLLLSGGCRCFRNYCWRCGGCHNCSLCSASSWHWARFRLILAAFCPILPQFAYIPPHFSCRVHFADSALFRHVRLHSASILPYSASFCPIPPPVRLSPPPFRPIPPHFAPFRLHSATFRLTPPHFGPFRLSPPPFRLILPEATSRYMKSKHHPCPFP
jgi:hypothetical protein